jgi:hypothetical protein
LFGLILRIFFLFWFGLAQERNIIITGSLPNILRQSSERNHANHKQQIQEEDDEEVIDTRMQASYTYCLQCI